MIVSGVHQYIHAIMKSLIDALSEDAVAASIRGGNLLWIPDRDFCILSPMCGRFIQITDPEKIKVNILNMEVDDSPANTFRPRYNIAPTQNISTVLNTPVPRFTYTHWGLIPSWAKDRGIGQKLINARVETLLEKPSFRDPFRKQRCIIFADGFYEWKGTGRSKSPFFIRMKDKGPFALAALWDRWADKSTGATIFSSTIITTEANSLIEEIHHRMPVILALDHMRLWLSADPVLADSLKNLLRPFPAHGMEAYEISRLVNNPNNDSADLIRPAA
jgi:putative SOS response-associated peptidase YedK